MVKKITLTLFLVLAGFTLGFFTPRISTLFISKDGELLVPTTISLKTTPPEPPLQKYAISRLSEIEITPSPLQIGEEMESTSEFTRYLFTWTSRGKVMTGQLTLPRPLIPTNTKALIMLRGYVPQDNYTTGIGTQNAAAIFARNGYITIAPDFFGYGGSDSEPSDTWQARFEKPVIVKELIDSVQKLGIQGEATQPLIPTHLGIWAHSNGGQIALTTLEAYQLTIPTTLWAPVSAPFPYAIQFFSDELEDEGKAQRAWISLFEKEYDVFDFSLTQHLDRLQAPLQLHHGELDDAAPIAWSDEFVEKLTQTSTASDSATGEPYPITYYRYAGTDHNLQPKASWNTAVSRDLRFFSKHFTN